jgi:TPR repeat protein
MVTAPPAAEAPSSSSPVVRTLEPREVASFLSRAQDLISSGDLQSARLLLRRAAEAQNARAAFALAQTYDPIVLKRFGASAPTADVAAARSWYEKAREWGAPDAQRQLDALDTFAR